jgi:transmembrane sensor
MTAGTAEQMNEVQKIPDHMALEAAATWLVRLQADDATGDDWLAFEAWLAAEPVHALAYDQVERLWLDLDVDAPELQRALASDPAPAAFAPPLVTTQRRPRRRNSRSGGLLTRRGWMGAAGGAIAAGLAAVLVLQPQPDTAAWMARPTVYDAPAGQTRDLKLSDGTQVRLNAGSRISVHVDQATRRVQMADAEAVFDVAHDTRRPFLIRVGDQEVRVVGTQFNLRRRDGRVVLTVSRGVVEVRPLADARATPTRVTVGQELVHMDGESGSLIRVADTEAAFGWTSGRLVYRDAPLSEVAADLQRRYARPVRIADAETARIRFSGVLTLDDEAAVLRRLTAFAPVDAHRAADGAVVLQKRG